jgi:hypothetical protein
MSDEKAFSGSILRVFEARAKLGCADSLAKKFATASVDVVRNQPGNQGHFFGKSVSDEDDVFLFVSVWRDLNALSPENSGQGRVQEASPPRNSPATGSITRVPCLASRRKSRFQQTATAPHGGELNADRAVAVLVTPVGLRPPLRHEHREGLSF